jgi:hypothetical protein
LNCIFFKIKFGEFAYSKDILGAKFTAAVKRSFCLLLILLVKVGLSQSTGSVELPTTYPAGYQNLMFTDSSRHYKPGAKKTDRFYFRPLEVDIWYPGKLREQTPMPYGEFLNLLQERSNRFQDDTSYQDMTANLVKYISAHLNIEDSSRLPMLKTHSYRNAKPLAGNFPLIVYMTAFNGMSYENIRLFEFLAGQGYVVASISSVGRYPGNMGTGRADLQEQVQDGSFCIQELKKMSRIDSSEIGLMGYSWGGLAACGLAIEYPEAKCMLSFDGSEMHYYGESVEEDQDFNELRSMGFLNPGMLRMPYAYLESGGKQEDRSVDSIYNMLSLLSIKPFYARFPAAVHEDFSCLPSLLSEKKSPGQILYSQFCNFSLCYFDQYLKNKPVLAGTQRSAIFYQQLVDSLYPQIQQDTETRRTISGRIFDLQTNQPLAFVNVGIPGENTGTVSGRDGTFKIACKVGKAGDSLKFSMVGYSPQSFSVREMHKQSAPIAVGLSEYRTVLQDVIVTGKRLPEKILGNTTTSKFVSVGLPLKFLGTEIGVKINLGKNAVWLKSFHFNVSNIRLDTAVFRLNIYRFKNGRPEDNILQKNIFIPVGRRTGIYSVDLSGYKLLLKDDILISIEWIEGTALSKENGALFLSASFLSAATWHRITSQAEWKKATGLGVGFNLDVQQMPRQ